MKANSKHVTLGPHPDAGEDEVDEVRGQRGEPGGLEVYELDLGRPAAGAGWAGGAVRGWLVVRVGLAVFEEDVRHQLEH